MTAADTQILLNKLQSNINQLELTNKGALNALEFRLDAILQANLDTFWLLICAILVFLMQAGFMCLETGLSRNKNSINVALKNVSDFGISVVVFWAFGFALMYGTSVSGLFGTKFFFFTTKVAGYQTYFVFQAMFVATAATIISGAVAERLKFFSYIIITLLVSGLFYPIVGHWSWAFNFENPDQKFGWLGQLGYLDFAGASVVHSVGGWIALSVLLVVGNRTGRFREDDKKKSFQGSNTPMAALGALILWFGWFGFNGGANGAMDLKIPLILINTFLSASFGLIFSSVMGIIVLKKPEPLFMITGPLAGLVSITASCAYVDPTHAIIIGSIGGIISGSTIVLLEKIKIDDVVSAIPVHLACGIWGTIAVALFANFELMGVEKTRLEQIYIQLIGISSIGAFCFIGSYLILKTINSFFPLRVSKIHEELGLNISEHNASTDTHELLEVLTNQAKSDNYSSRAPQDPFTESGIIGTQYNVIMNKLEQSEKQKNKWKNRVSKEIKLAMNVQQRLMPKRDIENYPIFGLNIPAREISGDFYDFYLHDDEVYFTLSDVSGKGVNAGMVMAKAITLFKIFAKQKFKPNEILLEMNNDLKETNPVGTFITSIVGRYNLKTDLVEIANAGHQPTLLKVGKDFKEYPSSSMPLAVIKHKDESVYQLESFKLNGGRIYCFTDGFSECMDENKQEIGIDGVKELILKHTNSSLQKELTSATEEIRLKSLKKEIVEDGVKKDNDILDDDLTIIAIGK
ncbi:Ammonium transporter family protein [Candidatus Pelagibacter ubique HTCC1002]|jgi:Amt family ammonium transporter|uniref:Ammonium transporter n=1 Tax=Pelagibacter ubique (strain HTCC1002) TaxID=314261 RepID=Q1V0F7_PELU1|nr:ammonium transporter [Candidatus Pelagibacter ubique]EAS85271.1 Ammonium transporter family protein [Candidatus Pelagibacter ubique HTCC1002]